MDFKLIALEELNKMIEKHPNYSLTEIIYSVLTNLESGKELGWLLSKTDYELYTAIENATQKENE